MTQEIETRQYIIALAMKFLGTPYVWGGCTPAGFDCSGFVIWILQVFNILPAGDWTAAMLAKRFTVTTSPQIGDLVFYGRASDVITHVMFFAGVNADTGPMVVGASGGDHTTTTIEAARLKGAMVKYKGQDYRRDRLLCVDIMSPKSERN